MTVDEIIEKGLNFKRKLKYGIGQISTKTGLKKVSDNKWVTVSNILHKNMDCTDIYEDKINEIAKVSNEAHSFLQKQYGENYKLIDVIRSVGGLVVNNLQLKKIDISRYLDDENRVIVSVITDKFLYNRIISPNEIRNALFIIESSSLGNKIGTKTFATQVGYLIKNMPSIKSITVFGGKSDKVDVGYYAWPRIGCTTPEDSDEDDFIKSLLKRYKRKETSLSELVQTQEGRDFWREKGTSLSLRFELDKKSENVSILNEYLSENNLESLLIKALKDLDLQQEWVDISIDMEYDSSSDEVEEECNNVVKAIYVNPQHLQQDLANIEQIQLKLNLPYFNYAQDIIQDAVMNGKTELIDLNNVDADKLRQSIFNENSLTPAQMSQINLKVNAFKNNKLIYKNKLVQEISTLKEVLSEII